MKTSALRNWLRRERVREHRAALLRGDYDEEIQLTFTLAFGGPAMTEEQRSRRAAALKRFLPLVAPPA